VQSFFPEQFQRDMGCTESDWLGWLPRAMGDVHWQLQGNALHAQVAGGQLHITWQVAEPRRLGLAVIPRLQVRFSFAGVTDGERLVFMKRFDLYTHRGGG
jgi:hypothetical protein